MEDESDDKDDTKRKSRNLSEKKRRDQFNTLVNDLNALISTSSRKMDKSTVLRSTIAFLKHHNEATDRSKVFEIQQDWKPSFLTNDEFTHLMLEALDGFIIVFSSNGSIYYASESITSLLGYLPRDILNMTVFDLTYGMDHDCLKNIFLNPMPVIEPFQTDITASNQITFHAHMKRGGIDKVDANAYELVKFVGYFRNDANVDNLPMKNTQSPPHKISYMGGTQASEVDKRLVFVGTGRVQTPQLIREMSAIDPTRNEFTSKHSMEWKFLFLDHRAPPIIGYMPFEVLGTSGYDYYHFDDLEAIVASHEELMQKGEGKSCYYRFLTKGQQWIWLQTELYVSYNQYNPKPEYVVCTHKVVSYADVIKQNKASRKCSKTFAVNVSASKTSTMTLQDIEANSSNSLGTCIQTSVLGSNASPILLNDMAPTYDTTSVWPETATTTPTQTNPHKTSRPSSGYDNISSTGISPNLKRKRYFHHHSRGNESDSTSMSADSGTSRHSLLTHLSSHSRHRQSFASAKLHQNPAQHQQHQQQSTQNHLEPQQQQHQQHQNPTSFHQTQQQHALRNIPPTQAPSNMLPTILQQHSIATETMLTPSTPCQFTQTAFPLHNAPIVAPTFLEPSQFLAAIPVQPVIAPFPVTPVSLSPIAVSLPNVATKSNPTLQTSYAQHRSDMVPGAAVVIRPTQTHLQDQLQRKHDELQSLIMQQQDELRIVSEQLLLARYTLLQPVLPMNYNNASGGSMRNFNFANNNNNNNNINNSNISTVDNAHKPHSFGHHEFNLNTEHEQQLHQSHQGMVQQQQVLQQHQSQQQILPHQQQQHLQMQQQQQQTHQHQHQSLLSNSQQLQQHQQQLLQAQQQQQQQQHQPSPLSLDQENLLSRSVPDLEQFGQDDIDAFLNLSPLLGCSDAILNSGGNSNNNSNPNNNSNNNINLTSLNSTINNNIEKYHTFSNNTQHNDDSLLSYMQQKSIEPSPGLNFQMGLSEDDSETHSEDAKLLNNQTQQHLIQQQQHQTQQQQQQSQQQNNSYFSSNSFQAVNQVTNSADKIPNDLEILPFQMSQEQSRNIFRPPHTRRTSQ